VYRKVRDYRGPLLVSRAPIHTVRKLLIVTANWSSVCIPYKVVETEKIKDKIYGHIIQVLRPRSCP
jgi:hypothetical protein